MDVDGLVLTITAELFVFYIYQVNTVSNTSLE
jgi:hypothetical protein